jgi:O-6-methylguanine DNA methyltransferase
MRIISYGPRLHVQVHVLADKIIKTTLAVRDQEGISWELVGQLNKGLEKNIDQWFIEYCSGCHPFVKLPLDFNAFSPFTQAVFGKLSLVPFGQSLSYQKLAILVDNPNASRAVGNACGRNPVPLFLPCHRVLTSKNQLGGFSLGLELKKTLLFHEKITF